MVCDLDNTVKVILIYIFRPIRIYMKLLSVNLVTNLWIYVHDFYNSFKHCERPYRKNVLGDYCRCTMECLLQMQNKIKKKNKRKQTTNTHTKNKKQKRKVLKIRLLVLAVHSRETRKDANETRRDSREARLVSRVLSEMRLARWW